MSHTDDVEELGTYILAKSRENGEFPCVRTRLYGEMPAPRTLSELFRYLEAVWLASMWTCWRGQADIGWRLDSTAARRLREHEDDIRDMDYEGSFEDRMRNYEERLLDQARMAGYGIHGGRRLSDLELLSVMRHYGAATRLMDFSRNAMVALWFACADREKREEYGLLVGLDRREERRIQNERELETPVTELIDVEEVPTGLRGEETQAVRYCYWEPRHLFERMRVQQSAFVFGRAIEHDWGTAPIPFDLSKKWYREPGGSDSLSDSPVLIAISPDFKAGMDWYDRSFWRNVFGYDDRSLFPDLEGFSAYHGAQQQFEEGFFYGDPARGPARSV